MRSKTTRILRFEGLEQHSMLSATPFNDISDAMGSAIESERIGQSLGLLKDYTSDPATAQYALPNANAMFEPLPMQIIDERIAIRAAVADDSTTSELGTYLKEIGFEVSTLNDALLEEKRCQERMALT